MNKKILLSTILLHTIITMPVLGCLESIRDAFSCCNNCCTVTHVTQVQQFNLVQPETAPQPDIVIQVIQPTTPAHRSRSHLTITDIERALEALMNESVLDAMPTPERPQFLNVPQPIQRSLRGHSRR